MTQKLSTTPQAQARNLLVQSIKYKASITPKKDKDKSAIIQCVQWRTKHEEQEKQKIAVVEEKKR